MEMSKKKLEIILRKTIKPSSSTPQHLQTFELSFWDEPLPPDYGTIIFFYQTNGSKNDDDEALSIFFQRSSSLQNSLSKTLIHYYPLAGRLKDDGTAVDCNDEGAYFVEARIDCQLSTLLNHPDADFLSHYFCPALDSNNLPSGCMLAIQLTLFNCGGIAISVSPSHKIADASSACTFVQSWASMTTIGEVAPKPIFLEPSSSPPRSLRNAPMLTEIPGEFVKRRFVFPASKIAQLRTKTTGPSSPTGKQHMSDADLVMALFMKCAILASRSLSKSSSGPYVLFQVVDLRKRVRPPLPANTIGNVVLYYTTQIEENQIELNELAGKFRKSLNEFCNLAANSSLNEEPEFIIQGSPYCCTNLCGFPFYEIDFGWGKPSWVTTELLWFRNIIVLQKTKDGDGIELWVSMDEKEMALFEQDHDIIAYASNNPSVLAAYSRM
uniref:Cocaine synthase n=1 Tax=Erythroxylum coca TaxID=289672 RepID=A0A059Q4T4_ERYCB|nr:cocaine synthase [Erythroxylum coca]